MSEQVQNCSEIAKFCSDMDMNYDVYGKTFAVVHKIHCSLENFCGASGRGHHVLYTASNSRRKLSRSAEKPRKFSHLKVLPYTVVFAITLSQQIVTTVNMEGNGESQTVI